jgi:hypothetical protein
MMVSLFSSLLVAVTLLSQQKGDVSVVIESNTKTVSPAKSVILTLKVSTNSDKVKIEYPDLRERLEGFSLAEEFSDETSQTWRLVSEPYSKYYKIKPFVVGGQWFGPVYFDPPENVVPSISEMKINPKKDFPPLTLRFVAKILAVLLLAAIILYLTGLLFRFVSSKIKEHRMSPIERAWVELDRLVKKALPLKGRYKDYYVELTMVVRRYVQRKYGVKAPHLTTQEFLQQFRSDALKDFLESADLIKFAGVKATSSMAESALLSARDYLKTDSSERQEK